MKIHKLEVIVFDPNNEDLSRHDVEAMYENAFDFSHLVKLQTKDDGKEWDDNSPLNFSPKRADNYFKKLQPPT